MFSLQAFLMFSFLLLYAQSTTNTLASENTFVIRIDPSVKPVELQVRYLMTGDFGGFGGYEVDRHGESEIQIHTQFEGKPAKGLKVVLYAPGCQIKTISIVDLSTSSREGEFRCAPLGYTRLQGKFSRGPTNPGRKIEIQIQYLGFWGHAFWGITDGFVLSFDVAKSSVEPDGSFQAYLPNFAESGELSSRMDDASFWFAVRDIETGNSFVQLKPQTMLSRDGNLKIIPSYPQTIKFDVD